jgi:hypothetical protein
MATQDPTANYGWDLPDVGGDSGAWGAILNSLIGDDADSIDFHLNAVSVIANAAMPKAGGTFTGEVKFLDMEYTVVAMGSISSAQNLDLATGNMFTCTIAGATTFTIVDSTLAEGGCFVMVITNGGSSITWDAAVVWAGGTPPTLTASGSDLVVFMTPDGGTTWIGMVSVEDFS